MAKIIGRKAERQRKTNVEYWQNNQFVLDTVRGRRAIRPVIVTTYGLAKNEYSSRIQNIITMDDLFK